MPNATTDPRYYLQVILSQRDYTVGQVKEKLKKRGFAPNEVAHTIAWGEQKGWLDDEKYAENFIENTLRVKHVGPKWIRAKLQQRHVSSEIITEVLQAAYPSTRERKVAKIAASRWRTQHPSHASDKTRLNRFLASRGFSANSVWEVV
jgi:regulatory protein